MPTHPIDNLNGTLEGRSKGPADRVQGGRRIRMVNDMAKIEVTCPWCKGVHWLPIEKYTEGSDFICQSCANILLVMARNGATNQPNHSEPEPGTDQPDFFIDGWDLV